MAIKLDIHEVAKEIGIPLDKWPGNCHGIAIRIVEEILPECTAVYGHYTGPVHKDSIFYGPSKVGFVRHGWVLSEDGKTVIDPLRWEFEQAKPYIYTGPLTDEYDEGGNSLRHSLYKPPPAWDATPPGVAHSEESKRPIPLLTLDVSAMQHVRNLFMGKLRQSGVPSLIQLVWLANLPLDMLKPYDEAIYKAIEDAGQAALIPYDNRQRSKREAVKRPTKVSRKNPMARRR